MDLFAPPWQIGIEKAQHVGALDRANTLCFLQIGDALSKLFHFRPVHFRPEMMFGVVTVVEEEPVVNFSVTAHAPRDRFVGIRTVMAIVTVQVTEAVAEIPERQEINDEPPVDEMDRPSRNDHRHQKQRHGECR